MVTVALVGVTTGLGKTFLSTFLHLNSQATDPSKKHTIIVLSRSPNPELSAKGISTRTVDYTNHTQLVQALSDVHTVLPLIGGSSDIMRHTQLVLLRRGYEGIDMYAGKAEVLEAVRASGLEYTRFNCGLFMSVPTTGTPNAVTGVGEREGCKTGGEEALAGLRPWNFVVDMKAGTVDSPGDGTSPLVLTDMQDVATFVYRALSLPSWPEDLGMRGDVNSFAELVAIAERVQGRTWLKKSTPMNELEERPSDPGAWFYNQTRLGFASGYGMAGDELNQAFPDSRPVDAETFVEKWWSGVELGEPSWEAMHNPM